MRTPKRLKFDASWNESVNVLYQAWYGGPQELKTGIIRLYSTLRSALVELEDMTHDDEELDFLIEDWWDFLREISDQTISYWDGSAIKSKLKDLTEDYLPEIQKEIRALKSRPKPQQDVVAKPPSSPVNKKTATTSKPKTGDLSDDEAFATAFGKTTSFGGAKAKSRPKDVRSKPKPYVPPTPQEEWADAQKKMGDECNSGYNRYINNRIVSDSDHNVTQWSVSRHLGGGSYFQIRPSDNTNDQMRIYLNPENPGDNTDQYWARGLSHAGPRNAGAFYVYRRTGKKTFVHVAGRKLEKHTASLI